MLLIIVALIRISYTSHNKRMQSDKVPAKGEVEQVRESLRWAHLRLWVVKSGRLLFRLLLKLDTAEYEIQKIPLDNLAISPKETLKTKSWEAAFGT